MGAIVPSIPYQEAEIDDFRGPWSRIDSTQVPPTEALLSRNSYYDPGSVGTRFGFGAYANWNAIATVLFNWLKEPDAIAANGNYIISFQPIFSGGVVINGIILVAVTTAVGTTLVTVPTNGTEGASLVAGGSFLFTCGFNSNGSAAADGNFGVNVIQVVGSSVVADHAFMAVVTPSASTTTTPGDALSQVTPGSHSIGYTMTSRSGFTTPYTGYISTTVTAGENITTSFTFSAPADCAFINWIMSPATNAFQYFQLPIPAVAVTPGVPNTLSLVIRISDAQLIANGTDVTNNANFLTWSPPPYANPNQIPPRPFKLLQYGPRIVYLAIDAAGTPSVYISDPDAFQQLTNDQNKLTLPGFRTIATGFVLRGVLYILGTNWTYAFQDTGDVPVTWPSVQLIDERYGSPCVEGCTVNSSSGWAAVVHHTGLYIFNGQYGSLPLSYMVDDQWQRINWLAQQTIRIVDNQDRKQLLMTVPLTTSSLVNINGATVTLASGDQFNAGWVNQAVTINGAPYTIASVNTNCTQATLSVAYGVANGLTMTVASPIPTHLFMFDYTDGLDYTTIKFSKWDILRVGPRGLCTFVNPATNALEYLLAQGSLGPIFRQKNAIDDTAPYTDNGQPIGWDYEIAPQPGGSVGTVWAHPGGYTRCKGVGTLSATSYGLDHSPVVPWVKKINLLPTPMKEYWNQFYLTSERCSVKFHCGDNAGDYCVITGYKHMYYPYASRR